MPIMHNGLRRYRSDLTLFVYRLVTLCTFHNQAFFKPLYSTNLCKVKKALVKNFFRLKFYFVEPPLKQPGHK